MKHKILVPSILSGFKAKKLISFFCFLSIAAGIYLQLLPSLLLKQITDEHIVPGIAQGVLSLAFVYLGAVLLSGAADLIKQYTLSRLTQSVIVEIKIRMSEKLRHLSIFTIQSKTSGEWMSYFSNDVDTIATLFTDDILTLIANLGSMAAISFTIYTLNPAVAFFVAAALPILVLISYRFNILTFRNQLKARVSLSRLNGWLNSRIQNTPTLRFFHQEADQLEKMQAPLDENYRILNKTNFYDSLFPCIMNIFRGLVLICFLLYAKQDIDSGGLLSSGSVVACVNLLLQLLAPVEAIAMQLQTIQEAASGVKRIKDFENLEEEERAEREINGGGAVIRCDDLTFAYPNQKPIFDGLSLTIRQGERIVIQGKTGEGKSTLMNLLTGLYAPNKGTVSLLNKDPFGMSEEERRQSVGVISQLFLTRQGTIRELITLNDPAITDEQLKKCCKLVKMDEVIEKLPNGYDSLLAPGSNALSNGQMQLLALACALIHEPPVLFLDEMTSGLDAESENEVFEVIRQLSQDRTIFTISHRYSDALNPTRILKLQNGRLVTAE
ncbi:ABC transporter ATP-binding protein [Dielma fastidiosa]|uniref:ABC transporter ATP-binding protein/permease n=1 Tax=Dielma fastidiosa TaxID=1034346 RepID=A0AB35UL97_9FIRM|nr:ABC transporter ATP-binding protein [Dielma fastidiosa]MDY5167264.1 ABC transporter ATP-binding protein/permease [Dielma fastidiosa]